VAAIDFNMLFVETCHGASLPCFDKTLGKNHGFYDFFPEFYYLERFHFPPNRRKIARFGGN